MTLGAPNVNSGPPFPFRVLTGAHMLTLQIRTQTRYAEHGVHEYERECPSLIIGMWSKLCQ